MKSTIIAVAAVVAAAFQGVVATEQLTKDTFSDKIEGAEQGTFVKFYAPWCGHCKRLAPTWDKLAEKHPGMVAKVDCTQEKELCSSHGVRGYPTLKYFKAGETEGSKYQGSRELDALSKYIGEQV